MRRTQNNSRFLKAGVPNYFSTCFRLIQVDVQSKKKGKKNNLIGSLQTRRLLNSCHYNMVVEMLKPGTQPKRNDIYERPKRHRKHASSISMAKLRDGWTTVKAIYLRWISSFESTCIPLVIHFRPRSKHCNNQLRTLWYWQMMKIGAMDKLLRCCPGFW